MPFSRMLAAGAATAALTVSGLSLAAPAQAAEAAQTSVGTTTASYTCKGPLGIDFKVPATWAVPMLPKQLEVGVPTGNIPFNGVLQMSGSNVLTDLLNGVYGLLGITLSTVTSQVLVPIGLEQVGVTLEGVVSTLASATTGLTSAVGGVIPSFTPSAEGTYTIALPTEINLAYVQNLLVGSSPIKCSLDAGTGGTSAAPLASYTVVRNTTTTGGGSTTTTGGTTTTSTTGTTATSGTAKSASSLTAGARSAKVRQGKAVRVDVAVAVPGPGTGTVYAYEKGRQVAAKALTGGTASFTFKKVKAGSHTYRFVYQGTASVAGSEQSVKVKVAKRR
jgi:hypothetical protein